MTSQVTPLDRQAKAHPICFCLRGNKYQATHNLLTDKSIDETYKKSFNSLADWLNFCGSAPILIYHGYKIRRVPVGGTYTITPSIPSFDELKQGLKLTDVQCFIDSYIRREEHEDSSSIRRGRGRRSQSFCGEIDLKYHS